MPRRSPCRLLLVCFCLSGPAWLEAQNIVSLADSEVQLYGAAAKERASDAAVAGDINADGHSDLVLGAEKADPDAYGVKDGKAYLVFGGPGLPGTVDLADLRGGITIVPGSEPGLLGHAVSDAGDFNADGRDDFVVTAERALGRGVVYVIFGADDLPDPLDVSTLGSRGVKIIGESGSLFGHSVSRAGDFNHDGFDDLVVGATRGKTVPTPDKAGTSSGRIESGMAYVIFGGPDVPSVVDVSSLGDRGVFFNGIRYHDELGAAVADAGDVNGDGIDDVVLGARLASPSGRWCAGEAYIVFGRSDPPPVLALAQLGSGGTTVRGAKSKDTLGNWVACSGDLNGDGTDDVIVCAEEASPGGRFQAGQARVLFGSSSPPQVIDLKSPGVPLLTLNGVGAGGLLGRSAHCVGDFNQDGVDDIIVGAVKQNAAGRSKAGQAYVVFGSPDLVGTLELSGLGERGIVLNGVSPGDCAGQRVANAGDVNGDDVPDVVIAALKASPLGREEAGAFYLLFGTPVPSPEGLACEFLVEGGRVELSWSSTIAYTTIRIDRNGEPLAEIDGTATGYVDEAPTPGSVDYEVSGLRGELLSLPAACSVSVEVLPPFDLVCLVQDGQVRLGWVHRNPVPVESSRILRDGLLIGEVPGDVRSFVDPSTPPGPHVYGVVDVLAGEASQPVECQVLVPAAVSDLACRADGEDVSLSWANADAYTAVRIFRDGDPMPVVKLTGPSESFEDHGLAPGPHRYEVQGLIGDAEARRVTCDVLVLPAISDLTGSSLAGDVTLAWTPPETGDEVLVSRDGTLLAELATDTPGLVDPQRPAGAPEYEVRVRLGESLSKPASIIVQVVDPVNDLRACVDGSSVGIQWAAGDQYDSLELFRDGLALEVLGGSATSAIDFLSETDSGPVSYSIVGVRGNGRSATVETTAVPLAPPADLAVTLTGVALLITWTNAEAYDAIRVRLNGEDQSPLAGDRTSLELAVDDLGEATVELRGVVETPPCSSVSRPAVATVPAVEGPGGLECSADGLEVTLSWTNGGAYDAIRIERNGETIATRTGDTGSLEDTLTSPGELTYRVFGVIREIETAPAVCSLVIPFAVEDLDCTGDGASVTLRWTLAGPHSRVIVERNGETLRVLPAGESSFVDDAPLTGLTAYSVRIQNNNAVGPATACEIDTPPTPSDLGCVARGNRVELMWTLPAPVGRVVVFRDGVEVSPEGGLPGDANSFVDEPVLPGSYCYTLQAISTSGTPGAASEPCCTVVPLPPVELVCRAVDAEGRLDWVNPREFDEIQIFRDGEILSTVDGGLMTFTDPQSPLPPGPHVYELVAIVGASQSEPTTCELVVPVEPVGLSCRQDGRDIVLSWELTGIQDAVEIRRNGATIATLDGNATMYRDENLVEDTYSYEVRAVTEESSSVPVECAVSMIRPPGQIACEVDGDRLTVSWDPSDPYETVEIRLFRQETLLSEQTLAGDATGLGLVDLGPGLYRATVRGVRGFDVTADAECSVEVLSPVLGLLCQSEISEALLQWSLDEPYEAITVRRTPVNPAGEPIGPTTNLELSGTDTMLRDGPLPNGSYRYDVAGALGGVPSPSATCVIDITPPLFIRGEINNDRRRDIADPIFLLNYLFYGRPSPTCLDAADVDDNGEPDINDVLWIIRWQFRSGPAPRAPFPSCGPDTIDEDGLDCQQFPEGLCAE